MEGENVQNSTAGETFNETVTYQPSGIDKDGLKQRLLAASRLSQEDKNFLIDLINKA